MPDSTTPASQMIRVPTPLVDAVKELSRLHRQGYTRAILTGLQQLIASVDSNADSATLSVRDSDITTASRIDSEVIAGMIAAALAPIQEQTTSYAKTSNIIVSEIENLNERVSGLERWKLDSEDISANISNANLACLLANPEQPIADTLARSVDDIADIVAATQANPSGHDADTSTQIADISTNPSADTVNLRPHNQMDLARRWGMIAKNGKPDNSQISRQKSGPNFTEWSRGKDPDGIGWRYDPESGRFHALQN